jgi:hypothetical protein
MAARPVVPVIPSASRGHHRQGKPGAGRPMPLTANGDPTPAGPGSGQVAPPLARQTMAAIS